VLNELITADSGLTHLFHARHRSVVWLTLSFIWSRMTTHIG